MYWHRVCECGHYIHIEGGGKGANRCFKNNFLKPFFLYLRECEYRPHMHSHNIKLVKTLPECIGFVPGGTQGYCRAGEKIGDVYSHILGL